MIADVEPNLAADVAASLPSIPPGELLDVLRALGQQVRDLRYCYGPAALRLAEWIYYYQRAKAAPILEIFRYQACGTDLDGSLDD
ncbi:MAG TPA: hypothetical protein VN695_00620 [Streptosporangiaceae bacterium]|nr:hypothetical protein [Streptosporangiaceae bacterium]